MTVLAGTSIAAFVAAPAVLAQPAPAVQGTYQHVVADRLDGSHVEQDLLVSGQKATPVVMAQGVQVAPGTKITARRMTRARLAAATPTTAAARTAPTAPAAAVTKQKVLVILATWTSRDTMTQKTAGQRFFGEYNDWFTSASYGAVGLAGDVTPWLDIAGPDDGLCYTNHQQVMQQAKAQAMAASYDSTRYDRTVVYFPKSRNADCSKLAGWAYQPGTEVWLNGVMNARTSVHELGHSMGLSHAGSVTCEDGAGAALSFASSGCETHEYGDAFDAMGASGYVGQFSAAHKWQLGWGKSRIEPLEVGQTATLASYGSTSGTIALKLTFGTRTYWVERRTAAGADAELPASASTGLLVRVTDNDGAPALIDSTPDGNLATAALPFGATWQLPEGPKLTVGAASTSGVAVTLAG